MFIEPSEVSDVFLRIKPVDFRKGINGLGCEVNGEFGDRFSGKNLFVFSNRLRNKVKVLYWDDTGFALWQKALEEEKFQWPKNRKEDATITTDQLKWLLSGLDIDEVRPHKKLSGARQFY